MSTRRQTGIAKGYGARVQGRAGSATRRGARGVSTFAALTLLVLGLGSVRAVAAETHLSLGPFGGGSGPTFSRLGGLAVDQSTGDIYAYDSGAESVYRFDSDGNPVEFSALGTNEIPAVGGAGASENEIAVDSSSGETAGDIYVANNTGLLIYGPEGSPRGELSGAEPCGVAVDSAGNVYVGRYPETVDKYAPASGQDAPTDADLSATLTAPISLCNVGVQGDGSSVYAATYRGAVHKYAASQFGEAEASGTELDPAAEGSLAVDPGSGHVFVDEGTQIAEFDAAGGQVSTFGAGELSESVGVAVDATSGDVYVANGETIAVFGPLVTVPDATTGEASGIGPGGEVTLNGTVEPDGIELTECLFEYGTGTAYGQTVACAETPAEIGSGEGAVAVHAELSGLPAGDYHFRLTAANANGPSHGADAAFALTGPPAIEGESAVALYTEAELTATINPGNLATTYHFEYGTGTGYGQSTPEQTIPAGSVPVVVGAHVAGLAELTSYHFRVVASNAVGPVAGADRTFTTGTRPGTAGCPNDAIRREQGVTDLPDCMALELVSPPQKYGGNVVHPNFSASGDRVLFEGLSALGGTPGLTSVYDNYVAERGPGSWATMPTAPPAQYVIGSGSAGGKPWSFDPEFGRWVAIAATRAQGVQGITAAFSGTLDGDVWSPLSPTLRPVQGGTYFPSGDGGIFAGTSADLSHLYLTPESDRTAYLPGDPEPFTRTSGANPNLYVAQLAPGGSPTVALLARDSAGRVYGGSCGALIGGGVSGGLNQGAIAADGSRVFFSARPAQSASEECSTTNPLRILERTETPSGPQIAEPISSECDRTSPPCSGATGDQLFQGASVDQSLLYFITNEQLTDGDLDTGPTCQGTGRAADAPGCDLYLYDAHLPAGHRLVLVSRGEASDPTPGEGAEVLGVVQISGDGSHVYFVAKGVLTTAANSVGRSAVAGKPNLYAYERDAAHPDGRTAFVATLQESVCGGTSGFSDCGNLWASENSHGNMAEAVPMLGRNSAGAEVGGDGHVLAFTTYESLVPGDTDGGQLDAYRYDADDGRLECVSCSPAAGGDDDPLGVSDYYWLGNNPYGADFAERKRWVSEDGETITFTTEEGLLSGLAQEPAHAYLWRAGELTQLPGYEAVVSHSGEETAFTTYARLLPRDGDTAQDIYVARADGGFPEPTLGGSCAGEACQGPPSAAPSGPSPATTGVQGHGNARPKSARPRRCPKGKRKVARKGKVRCVKKTRHRGGAKHRHKRHKTAAHRGHHDPTKSVAAKETGK